MLIMSRLTGRCYVCMIPYLTSSYEKDTQEGHAIPRAKTATITLGFLSLPFSKFRHSPQTTIFTTTKDKRTTMTVSRQDIVRMLDDDDDSSQGGDGFSDVLQESGRSKSEGTTTEQPAVVRHYKPRRLSSEEREKICVEQAELMAFFTLLYSATSLAIAVRLMTKGDEEEEFEKE